MPLSDEDLTTPLSRDVLGRYVCNTFGEARQTWENGPGFDAIVLGGGTFGAVAAQNLYFRSEPFGPNGGFAPPNYRILVLEAGPFILPEHGQNLPLLRLFDPNSVTSIADQEPDSSRRGHIKPRNEVWGLSWHSNERFVGLAYCVGGRSLYWGGWSPQLLDSEMPTVGPSINKWPVATVEDLRARFFPEANRQTGAIEANDFISGSLHRALRTQLRKLLKAGAVTEATSLAELPLQIQDPPLPAGLSDADLEVAQEERKIDAPYAVQTAIRSGFFPLNKFSSVPLLMAAARDAEARSGGDDNRKRLMVVPNCHVKRLLVDRVTTATGSSLLRIVGVDTSAGVVPVPWRPDKHGVVVLALAAIESARMALLSFGDLPPDHYGRIGKNLMAHTRLNVFTSVPRSSFPGLTRTLEVSALQVRGKHLGPQGVPRHFHLQVTASGRPQRPGEQPDADRELFQKIPDLDTYARFLVEDDTIIPIAIRGIAEMEPQNPRSYVRLDPERDEYGMQRAYVALNENSGGIEAKRSLTPADHETFDACARAMSQLATALNPARAIGPPTVEQADPLGGTHHEAGTLWMGEDPGSSVTNPDARFHFVENAFVGDLSVLPTVGSANPMLPGVALARRLGKHLVPEGDGRTEGDTTPLKPFAIPTTEVPRPALASTDAEGFQPLFDGRTNANWRMAGKGQFFIAEGALQSMPGTDLGLIWCGIPMPPDFILRLEWFLAPRNGRDVTVENSGVFVRFPHPDCAGFHNPAYVPVFRGFEIQIDPDGRGPDGRLDFRESRTGAIYGKAGPASTPNAPAGHWHSFQIRVVGDAYDVWLNTAHLVAFHNTDAARGVATSDGSPSFFGLQVYPGAKVAFRNIRAKAV